MERRHDELGDGPFDLLVVGGGLQGAWVAYDAALRGLRVALIEAEDWGASAPLGASTLLQGGLQRLATGESLGPCPSPEECSRLARLAPHNVRDLRLLIPFYSGQRPGWARLRMGLWLRQPAILESASTEGKRVLDADEVLRLLALRPEKLRGGFLLRESLCDLTRLTLELVHGATRAGAVAVNRAEALALLTEGRRVVGAVIQDGETGRTLEVRSLVTACCAGPWNARLVGPAARDEQPTPPRQKDIHLVLPGLLDEQALAIGDGRGRVALLLPWFGRTLICASTRVHDSTCDPVVGPAEERDLLSRVTTVLDGVSWLESDVIARFATVRCAPTSVSAPREPMDCLVVLDGGAGVAARPTAALAVDRVLRLLRRPVVRCPTGERPLPWCPETQQRIFSTDVLRRGLALGLDEETALSCAARYGARVEDLLTRIEETPELGRRIVPEAPFCHAELVYAVTDEMALTLEHVLRRRVPLLLVCDVPEQTIRDVAALLGAVRQWSEARRQLEIDSVLARCEPALPVHETA